MLIVRSTTFEPLKRLHLKIRILFEPLHGIRRKTRRHWRDINSARLQFWLQCIHVRDDANAKLVTVLERLPSTPQMPSTSQTCWALS